MARRNWYECSECETIHCGAAPGVALYVCPDCCGAIALKRADTEAADRTVESKDAMPLRHRGAIDALIGLRERFRHFASLSAEPRPSGGVPSD